MGIFPNIYCNDFIVIQLVLAWIKNVFWLFGAKCWCYVWRNFTFFCSAVFRRYFPKIRNFFYTLVLDWDKIISFERIVLYLWLWFLCLYICFQSFFYGLVDNFVKIINLMDWFVVWTLKCMDVVLRIQIC